MILLTYASVPIYNLFCKATGLGGTVQISQNSSTNIGKRQIIVKFDANIDKTLNWQFQPEQPEILVTTGENTLVFYSAKNLANKSIIGTAVYNVSPEKVGKYFNKIQCFCFEEQILKAGEKMLMPVSFFIDSALDKDPNLRDITTITLSYFFYQVK